MNIQQLFDALHPFEDTAAGSLIIPATSVTAWTDIHALIVAAMADQTLTITGITAFPTAPSLNTITYQGQATLFPWSGGGSQTLLTVTASFTVDQGGNPELLIRAQTPAAAPDWTLGDSLEGLAGTDLAEVVFDQGLFFLTSQTTTASDFPGSLTPFVDFEGVISTTGPFALGQALLPTPASRTVAGTISFAPGPMPTISLGPVQAAPITLAGIQFEFGAGLSSAYQELPYCDPDDPSVTTVTLPFSQAAIVATLAFGGGQPLLLSLPVLPQNRFCTLAITGATVPLSSWAELEPLTGGIDLGTLIPSEVPTATGMMLRRLELSLYFPDASSLPTVNSIGFDVMMNVGDWPLLPNDILTVQDVGALMTVTFGGSSSRAFGSLYSHFTIVEEVAMVAALSIPQLNFTAELPADVTVSVASLMDAVMLKLTGKSFRPPIDMDIAQLEMSVGILNRTFGFGADILTDWSIAFGEANGGALITLSFDGVNFDIDYDGQLLQGTFTARASVNEGQFYFTAASPGDGAGWGFSGGLISGSSLSVTNLLLNFMYPSGDIPGGAYGVPDLVIDQLVATLATDAENTPSAYTFAGGMTTSWSFSVFPGSPQFILNASLNLHGSRGAQAVDRFILAAPGRKSAPARGAAPLGLVDPDAPWTISGDVQGTLSLYGLLLSAGYQFSPDNSALVFGIWYKDRGIQATVTQQTDPKTQTKETLLTVRLGDLSFGEILEYLINLALPGETRRLSSPWDILYQLNFKNLSLLVNLTTHDIAIAYNIDLDLTFARFDAIRLVYKSVNGEGRVYIELTGEFLGQSFGGDAGEPLTWDVINDSAPEVPGKGPTLVDLRYVGMGQHIALSIPAAELDTVEKVITALNASVKPVSGAGNPLTDPAAAALRYDGNSNWMFGLDATLLDTVSLSAVFFDPTIYGGLITLAGPRAGGLAGLRFELLYRKITNDIGELSVDLRVPDMFRHIEMGEVSITLGVIHVDIFTNGNFRVDLGFPHQQDFSLSFAVEVFPFVGEGGFYFAYLTGATSDRVPLITNGEFSPVIEAGLGLAVGLGKDFQAGPLKAGLSVELLGIFEGVFAPFNPYDRSISPDNYFWIQGTAGIVGRLYGSVDFVIIRAEVSIVAKATVTFVIEAHRPSEVDLRLSVTAKAKVHFLFFTIHFSFSLTIEESFTIGSATATPWIVGTSSERLAPQAYHAESVRMERGGAPVRPRLRQQRSQASIRRLTRLRHARHHLPSLSENPAYRSLHWGRMAASRSLQPHLAAVAASPSPWTAVPVFGAGAPKTARLQFAPLFTIADPASLYSRPDETAAGETTNQIEFVLGFIAETSVPPEAHGHQAVRQVTTDHVHHLDQDGDPPMATMVDAFFRWAAQAGAGRTGSDNLTLLALQDLLAEVNDLDFQQATFGYDNLTLFLEDSLYFQIAAYPTGTMPSTTSGAFVPVMPPISAVVASGSSSTTRDYTTYNPASAAYSANLPAYFQQLQANATSGVAARPTVSDAPAPPPSGSVSAASLAELVFSQYFALLTQASLQAAIALLQNYPYTYPQTDGPSLQALAESFTSLSAPVTLGRGQTLNDLALMTGHHPGGLASANPAAAAGDSLSVDLPVGVTPLSIAEDNPSAPIAADLQAPMPALPYQVRSGQCLNDIVEAVPFVSTTTPLTAASIGAANLALQGLLREGASLAIPAFTYTPVTGDTQNFLTAFFQVRNGGVFGVPYLDWYEQAISTLNPDVEWAALSVQSAPIQVPTAYLNSAAAPAAYVIHEGDDLARIAAAFALFQAMDNSSNPAVTAPVTVPAMTHVVAAADTLASLTVDFPGLESSALIDANAAAAVLTPLAVMQLPPFTASIPAGQTLQSLATAYDLSLADLVDIVGDIDAIFVGQTALNIRDVPALTVDQFVVDLKTTSQLNTISTQVSNFLAHGLRAPAPDDATFTSLTPAEVEAGAFTGALFGLEDLVGQQFSWADQTVPVSVTLNKLTTPWLSFVSTLTTDDAAPLASPALAALNPRLAQSRDLRAGLILATDVIDQITLTIDEATFGACLPATTVTLDAAPPIALVNFDETGVRYSFQVTQHWQAGVRPTLPAAPAAGAPGEPSLWPLPTNLQQVATSGANLPFALYTTPLSAPPETEGEPLASYAWGVQIPIAIARVAAPQDPGDTATVAGGSELGSSWLDGIYLVKGAAGDDAERLYALWTYLAGAAKVEPPADSAALSLLYTPNGAGTAPKGYASDAVDPIQTVMLKTNLSTVTRDPQGVTALADGPPTAETYTAVIQDSVDFLALIWEASVVVEGGFYLRYDSGGAGLPDFVFDETGQGSLQILCLLNSQTSGETSGGPLLALNNVAVIGDNVDASAVQTYAQQTGVDAPTTRIATMPPGAVGFEITRVDPSPTSGDPTPAELAGMLYGLIGYQIGAGGGYVASNEAVPQGPAPVPGDHEGTGADVVYSQVVSLYQQATSAGLIAQHNPWLPAATSDPYAGVSATSAASFSFAAHDVFGNKALISDPIPSISIVNLYTDRLAGIGDWPGTNWSYTLSGTAPAARIEIDGALQANTYLPDPQLASEKALRSASAHALKFSEAFYQISRPGVAVSLTTSFAAAGLTPALAPLIGYVSAAYAFTSQIAALPIKTHGVTEGQTLAQVAQSYSVSSEDLLRDNLDRQVDSLFATQIATPRFAQVKHNETLNAFASRVGLTAESLLSQWRNGNAAKVPSGVDLAITQISLPLETGRTLADYAAAAQCSVGDLARANQATPGLIADGRSLVVDGVVINTQASTFASLVADFAQAGVTTNAEQIASLNQLIPDVFVPSPTVTTYAVDRRVTSAASTIDAVVSTIFGGDLAGFISLNGDLPGLIAQDTRLQIALETGAPPSVGLRYYLSQQNGLTVGDFALANGPSIMTTGSTLLLPALLDTTGLSATPYGIQEGKTFRQIAMLFGVLAEDLGVSQQDLPGVFVPGQPVAVPGCGSVTTTAEDSIASLIPRFPTAQPSLPALIDAIADQEGLMGQGAALVCPIPQAKAAGDGSALTLNALTATFLAAGDELKLAKANAALAGFLKTGASYTIAGQNFTVGPWQTLANSLGLINEALAAPLAYDDFLTAMLDQAVVDPSAKVLLPPPIAAVSAPLPATPAMVDTLTLLSTSLTLSRPISEIDPNFTGVPEVIEATTRIAAQSSGVPATLAGFASAVSNAYGGAIWIGASGRGDQGAQKQYAVRFDAPTDPVEINAIREVSLGGEAAYLGLPPLANALVSRTAAVRAYLSGTEPPFTTTTEATLFQAVDVNGWAGDFLATLDLVLSPAYASAGYAATATGASGSTAFNALVAAKESLANSIAAQLAPIEVGDTALDATAAQTALKQVLRANLSTGFATDAVIQVPSTVVASFADAGADTGGHRLSGKITVVPVALSTSTTLQSLATTYNVSLEGVGELLAATPNILATGVKLSLNDQIWTIGLHDDLNTGIETLQTDLAGFVAAFPTQAPLFRDGAPVTIDGYSAEVPFGGTLNTLADSLEVSLRYLSLANQDLTGLLTGVVYVMGTAVTITPATSSLSGLAQSLSLGLEVLTELIANQSVLTEGAVVHIVRWSPEYSLSTGKIDLEQPSGALTLLLNVKNKAQYRRLFVNLDFSITALEFEVAPASYVEGYETSRWLNFVNQLPESPAQLGGAIIATDIGQLDIPVPLRAYPSTPRLVNQRALATYTPAEIPETDPPSDQIAKAEAWSYSAGFEMSLAAQDTAIISIGLNYAPSDHAPSLGDAPDPFAALAEYSVNAAAIKSDLATLVAPGAQAGSARGVSAINAMADLATKVAANWGFVADTPEASNAVDDLVPAELYEFELQTRARSGPDGAPLLDALVLVRTSGTSSWGPDAQIPSLGYIDSAGLLQKLEKPIVPPGPPPASLTYLFTLAEPDLVKRTYVVWYDDLNVIRHQNARASLVITRNQGLVPGRETNPRFVYQTPQLTFANLATPDLRFDRSLLFGSGSISELSAALTTTFAEILGDPPTAALSEQSLIGRYGYRLAAADPNGGSLAPEDLVSMTPMFYRPAFLYDASVPQATQMATQTWFIDHVPQPSNVAFLSFSLQIYSGLMPARKQPLMTITRLDYQIVSD